MKVLLNALSERFDAINSHSCELIRMVPDDKLFWKPRDLGRTFAMFSCGEYILRSAAMVEKTFGGITTRLWDDPFEWTLPEELATGNKILKYLSEVDATRSEGFAFFSSDDDLVREIPAPERLTSIFAVLLDCLARSEHYQGRAFAIFQMFSDKKLPSI